MPRSAATVAEVLRQNGYATAMFGKNHNTPNWEGGPSGPFNHWPTGFGFDYFYGFNGWAPATGSRCCYENRGPSSPNARGTITSTRTSSIKRFHGRTGKGREPGPTVFPLFGTGATHSPHHAPAEWIESSTGSSTRAGMHIEKARSRGRRPWASCRGTELTPRPALIPAWNSLNPDQTAASPTDGSVRRLRRIDGRRGGSAAQGRRSSARTPITR